MSGDRFNVRLVNALTDKYNDAVRRKVSSMHVWMKDVATVRGVRGDIKFTKTGIFSCITFNVKDR